MFPSEKVWNGIHRTLHTRRRWYGIGLTLLLLTTAVVTWVMLLEPGTSPTAFASSSAYRTGLQFKEPEPLQPEILVATQPSAGDRENKTNSQRASAVNPFFASATTGSLEDVPVTEELATPVLVSSNSQPSQPASLLIDTKPAMIRKSSPTQNRDLLAMTSTISPLSNRIVVTDMDHEADIAAPMSTPPAKTNDQLDEQGKSLYPMTIESVVNSYTYKKNRKKLRWQIYAVPTISYRELKENMAFIREARSNGTIPTTTLPAEINSVVNHKPDIGFELGFSAGYPLSNNFRIVGGLQFNVSKYDIRAFNYQEEIATIALQSGSGANSVSTTSNYRSYGNTKANWLRNLYFSASAPVGVEVKFNSAKKSYAGFTTTLQPSYMLSYKSYLLSTDYKNYAEVPSLIRKWNLNTGFEVFAGYTTKKLEWRIGPQVRYQTLSSFKDKYPVREHLVDFGLKVGVMLK
jgi:hypothetical protein